MVPVLYYKLADRQKGNFFSFFIATDSSTQPKIILDTSCWLQALCITSTSVKLLKQKELETKTTNISTGLNSSVGGLNGVQAGVGLSVETTTQIISGFRQDVREYTAVVVLLGSIPETYLTEGSRLRCDCRKMIT